MRRMVLLSVVAVAFGLLAAGWLTGAQLGDPLRPHRQKVPEQLPCERSPSMQLLPRLKSEPASNEKEVFGEIRSLDEAGKASQRKAYEQVIFPRANQLSVCAKLIENHATYPSVVVEVTHLGRVDDVRVRGAPLSDALSVCVMTIVHRWVFPTGPQAVILELPIQDCPAPP